jgi:hypothetical protein
MDLSPSVAQALLLWMSIGTIYVCEIFMFWRYVELLINGTWKLKIATAKNHNNGALTFTSQLLSVSYHKTQVNKTTLQQNVSVLRSDFYLWLNGSGLLEQSAINTHVHRGKKLTVSNFATLLDVDNFAKITQITWISPEDMYIFDPVWPVTSWHEIWDM